MDFFFQFLFIQHTYVRMYMNDHIGTIQICMCVSSDLRIYNTQYNKKQQPSNSKIIYKNLM